MTTDHTTEDTVAEEGPIDGIYLRPAMADSVVVARPKIPKKAAAAGVDLEAATEVHFCMAVTTTRPAAVQGSVARFTSGVAR